MASSTIIIHFPSYLTTCSSPRSFKFSSSFLAIKGNVGWVTRTSELGSKLQRRQSSGATCWFKFGKNGVDAEGAGIYGSQSRNDFDRDDVEHYFNYMGMLAVEGSYDKMEALLSLNIHPVDILLLMAASEGDKPKIEELMRAGARYDVRDVDGRTALDRAPNNDIRDLISQFCYSKGIRFFIFIVPGYEVDETMQQMDDKWLEQPINLSIFYGFSSINE